MRGPGAEAVRLNAYVKQDTSKIVLHLVNYAVPLLLPDAETNAAPAGPLRVRVDLPEGRTACAALGCGPDDPEFPVAVRQDGRTATVEWPSLKVYGALTLSIAAG